MKKAFLVIGLCMLSFVLLCGLLSIFIFAIPLTTQHGSPIDRGFPILLGFADRLSIFLFFLGAVFVFIGLADN